MKRLSGGRLLYQIARGIVLLAVSLPSGSVAQTSGVVISEGLVIAGGDWYQSDRTVDPIEAMIVNGKWSSPTEGAVVVFGPGDERRWRRITADADGWLKDDDVPGGYVFATVDAEKERIAILEAMAHRMVYVNGVPRAGNLYQYKETWESWEPRFDYSRLPILLHKGRNELLLQGGRFSGVKIRIETPSADVMINERDITAPDAIVGVAIDDWLGVTLINTTTARLKDKNMSRRPHIALCIADPKNPYRYVQIRGSVVERTLEGAEAHIDKLNLKYHGNPQYPKHNPKQPRVIYKIQPEKVDAHG